MLNLIKYLIRHFKTISFFGGFALDLFILPKTTSPYYIWIGPVDIAIILLFLFLRQTFKRQLKKREKKVKDEIKLSKDKENVENKKTRSHKLLEKLNTWTTFSVSFFLGTLLSHTLVYYFRSSDILQMWPIFLIIFIAILANEFLYGIVPDILLFFVALTLWFIFNVPFVLNKVNTYTFFISILVSVIATSIITLVLQRIYLSKKEFIFLIIFSIVFPFLLLRLYYINYIPAVPLALGDSGFYSSVEKENVENKYIYKRGETGLIQNKKFFFLENDYYDLDTLIKIGEFYFFSSIISPADVSADITHIWEKYDHEKKIWIKQTEITYPISGGREDGYRGYSNITNISEGDWRVKVTADGRLIGLKKITVK